MFSTMLIENQMKNEPIDEIVQKISTVSIDNIATQIDTDEERLAFWINIYNGYIQYILRKNPELYEDRGAFFDKNQIDIGGRLFSFAEIEHGIIRKSAFELFLGYLHNPFPPDFEEKLRVEDPDWRIHFALNCGAKSCPPVAVYHPEKINEQLDYMTRQYLREVTDYDPAKNRAYTTTLFSWFRGDFGGSDGIRRILRQYGATPVEPKYVQTKEYDWTLSLDNFRTIPIN